jgi:hypothetical protein
MSNKSQFPKNARRPLRQSQQGQKPSLGMFLEKMKEAAERKAAELQPDIDDPTHEYLNILPMPDTQVISEKWIEWQWNVFEHRVFGILYTQSYEFHQPGSYEVQLSMSCGPKAQSVFVVSPDEAKALGQALISASNWRNIWKEHAGYFLEKQLMQQPVVDQDLKDIAEEEFSDPPNPPVVRGPLQTEMNSDWQEHD